MTQKIGLVLTGGGARAAYQAGVLKAIGEFSAQAPFSILAGVSAGAINAAFLAGHSGDFEQASTDLWDAWAKLKPDQVFKTDRVTLGRIGLRWMAELSMGGFIGGAKSNCLLDTEPLAELLRSWINFDVLHNNIATKKIGALAVSATNLNTGTAISFYETTEPVTSWVRSTRAGMREKLSAEHVLASSAIPIFFPPVAVHESYYGDGCIRLNAPLSPAIHMGATRLLAIGIRYPRPTHRILELNETPNPHPPALADIAGVLLNAVFLDSLDSDIERLERINRTVSLIQGDYTLKEIPILAIRPSLDLGTLASELVHQFPKTIRHLLQGIGATEEKGWDLLSYLAFDEAFTGPLLELGYRDGLNSKKEILDFIGDT